MSKPNWKIKISKLNKILTYKKKINNINIWDKDCIIPKTLQNKNVFVYNGKEFKLVKITEDRIGYKFGEFVATRKPYIYKGKKKIIKKIK